MTTVHDDFTTARAGEEPNKPSSEAGDLMVDVMVDLETRGTGPGCAILSIGAVAFDPETGELGETFYSLVSAASCRDLGLREEVGTTVWWNDRSVEARAVLAQSEQTTVSLIDALIGFSAFVERHGGEKAARVWGNGAAFDNAILADLYRRLGLSTPWAFFNSRCYRTLKNLSALKEPTRQGVHHNALDDAVHQAGHACVVLNALSSARAGKTPPPAATAYSLPEFVEDVVWEDRLFLAEPPTMTNWSAWSEAMVCRIRLAVNARQLASLEAANTIGMQLCAIGPRAPIVRALRRAHEDCADQSAAA